MGYQMDNARTHNGRTILVPCLQVAFNTWNLIRGKKVTRAKGINGIECGPLGYNEYGFPRGGYVETRSYAMVDRSDSVVLL